MGASEQLGNLREALLNEIAARAEKWEIEEAKLHQRSVDQIRGLLAGDMGDAVYAGWHIEGYDGAEDYLNEWAPDALAQFQGLCDDDLETAFKDREFWNECLVAAIGGAKRGLRTALDQALAAEKREAE
jgi:hypothetical protein